MAQPDITIPRIGLRARQRADMEQSPFIGATEEESLVETAWKEFVLRLAERHDDIFLSRRFVTTVAGEELIDVHEFNPKNVLKFRGVQHYENSSGSTFLRRLDLREEMMVSGSQRSKPTHYSYFIEGEFGPQLKLYPKPDAAYTLRIYYFPFMSLRDVLVSGGFFHALAAWDEYLVLSVAIKMKDKEESDCAVLLAEKDQLFDLMMKSITPIDEGEPAAVVQQRPGLTSIYDDPFAIEDRYGYG